MQRVRQDETIDGSADLRRPAAGGLALSAEVTDRLEAMRRHLTAARPASGNEALRLLRAAFPHAPLAERVKAAETIDRYRF
jgi:hypothetical protein